jgi:ferritin
MLHDDICSALNNQINQEMSAAYSYLAMAAHFDTKNLDGFASWMMTQHLEEHAHAMRLYRYLLDRGGKVALTAIAQPNAAFDSVRAVFNAALEQEKQNTASIHELYKLAQSLDDFATQSHLQWFLDEQVEEEKIFDEALALLDMAGDDASALLMLNEKLGQRGAAPAGADGGAGAA